MPAFLINLLGLYIFRPQLTELSGLWLREDYAAFSRRSLRIVLGIVAAGAFCVGVGALAGIPLLSWLYGVDLITHREALVLCLTGGTLNALCSFFYNVLAIQNEHRLAPLVYGAAALYAAAASHPLVRSFQVTGAALSYLTTYAVVGLLLAWLTTRFTRKKRALMREPLEDL